MIRNPSTVMPALATIAALLPGAAASQSPVATVHAFHAALAAGDSARALELLLPTVVIYEGGGVENSRDEYRAHHLPADMAYSAATTREVTALHADSVGDAAWVLATFHVTGTFRGRTVDSRGTETMVLRRTAQGWRIAHIHWSTRRQP